MDEAQLSDNAVELSVVLCTYTLGRWDHLVRAVRSVTSRERAPREVVIVVDHDDALLERARTTWAADRLVRVVPNAYARGLSGARNTGLREAVADVVAFLDDDAVAERDWTARLLRAYDDPRVVAAGGSVVADVEGERPAWWPGAFDWVIGCSWPGLPAEAAPVRNLIGANMSVRRQIALDAGGFPGDVGRVGTTPTGCEETELFISIGRRWPDAIVLYDPAARVRHAVGAERLSWPYFRARCLAEGRSKAAVASRVGPARALASERSYVRSVLPGEFVKAISRGAVRRALATVTGLVLTTAGYIAGRLALVASGRDRRLDPMAKTAVALAATTVVNAGLGVAFWAAASRLYPPRLLGESAALISAMMLLSIATQLDLATGIPRLLPQIRDRRWRPVAAAYASTGALGTLVGAAFVVLAPHVAPGFGFLGRGLTIGALLVVGVVLWNVFALQDAVLTATRRAVVVPLENGLFGGLKIALIAALAGVAGHGIFAGWIVAMAVMVVPVNAYLFGTVLRSRPSSGPASSVLSIDDRASVARYLGANYVAALLSQGSSALLPLLVIAVLGRVANAYFYVAFLAVTAVGGLTQALCTSLLVEGAHDETALPSLARRSIRRYLLFVAPGVVVLGAGAPVALALFGGTYAAHATDVLRLLLAGTIPQALVSLYLGVERVRARAGRVVAVEAALLLLVSAGSITCMRRSGIAGVGVAWLVSYTVVAVGVLPSLLRVVRSADADTSRVPGLVATRLVASEERA